MRNLRSIVGIPIGNVNHIGHDPPTRGRIASKLVSHKPTGTTTLPFQELTKESYRGIRIAPLLDENVDDVTVLVYRAIKITLLPTNTDKNLVHMPRIAMLAIPPTQSARVAWPEVSTPLQRFGCFHLCSLTAAQLM